MSTLKADGLVDKLRVGNVLAVRHIMSSDSTTLFINRSSDNHAPALAENSLSSPLISPFIAASLGVDTVSVVELLIQLVYQDLECVSALPDELNSSADQVCSIVKLIELFGLVSAGRDSFRVTSVLFHQGTQGFSTVCYWFFV
ncbi:unnamed protein product [Cylicocyclus nassatus]|uniref:Uncharacterized protein n=1 Tax=Cylicocyclus nassatus TaxID=53992 RepID=A0AA36MDJ7_CYLNA|nr:unnamed protein product [Cylicocyclus nassatus]